MKNILITYLLLCSYTLKGQYGDYLIGSKSGFAFSLNEEGNGSSFVLDFQKHFGLGVYGVLHFGQGHMTRGQYFSSQDQSHSDMFQADVMRQYNNYGLGIRKVLALTAYDNLSISFTGIKTYQRVMNWQLSETESGAVDLRNSQEQYGQRNDLSFIVSLNYLRKVRDYFQLGIYVDYHSNPKLYNIGLRSAISLNKKNKEKVVQKSSQVEEFKNALSYRLSAFGGDGTDMLLQYDIEYSKLIWSIIDGYLKFSTGKKHSPDFIYNFASLPDDDLKIYDDLFLTTDHEGERIWLNPIHSTSYGAGLKFRVNKDGRSVLSLATGVVYYRANIVELNSVGTDVEEWRESFRQYAIVMPEFAAYYDFNITDKIYLGVKSSLALNRFNFGVGIHGGIRF